VERRSPLKSIPRILGAMLGLLMLGWPNCAAAQRPGVEYQQRPGRYEGTRAKPVAGYDIELMSARADYTEPANPLPIELKVRFYLDTPSEAYLYVRELDYRYYYWLDKVTPVTPWGKGFENSFEWPSNDVIKQLDGLQMYDLGVVVRLYTPEPSAVERVAPVIFYHSALPARVDSYLFTFRLNGTAHINAAIYREGKKEPVFQQVYPRKAGGVSFTVRWDASAAPAGQYRMVIGGWFSDNNQPINQTVGFYHQPVVH
jgi:hypothetical protein